jgi:pimeloyl-ACP methyl ester carboxylesterase
VTVALGAIRDLRPRAVLPPIWREVAPALRRGAARDAAALGAAFDGGGRPVLLVPGFLAGDASLRPLTDFLAAGGYVPRGAGMALNAGCSEATLAALEARLEAAAEACGGPVAVVGHSRGGMFARVLAVRRPDLVSHVVTLGSPHLDQLAVHPLVWTAALAVGVLGSAGAGGLLSLRCGRGACCAAFRRDLAAPLPEGVRSLALFSRADGIVDWRSCVDPHGRSLEVAVGHFEMVHHPVALQAVGSALGERAPAPPPRLGPARHPGVMRRHLGARPTPSRHRGGRRRTPAVHLGG